MIVRLALRNSLRNVRRTLLTAVAIALSFALLVVFLGMGDGAHEDMARIGVGMGLGDVVVEAQGYVDDPTLDHRIHDPEKLRKRIVELPFVRDVATRLRTDALLTAGATSIGIALSGVDPAVESRVSKIDTEKAMVAGHALAEPKTPRARSELAPIVVGTELARTLDVVVGDRVTVTLRPAGGGETRSAAFAIAGIFKTGVQDVDAFWAEVPLADAERLAGAPNDATMLAVLLDDIGRTQEATQAISAKLAGEPVDVLPWTKAAPDLYAVIAVDEGGMYIMMLIVFVVVATGILNTLLMSVIERTREFGVLLALGATRGRIVLVVLIEAMVLGTVAMGVGLLLGLLGNHHFATVGIDISSSGGGGYETSGILLPDRLYSHLYPYKVAYSSAIVFGLVLLGAIYPALRAAGRKPVEAMHHD